LTPIDCRYATLALTPSTSRNCSNSAPGTTPAFQVLPPSVVTTNVPARPEAQTTCGFTGLTAISPFVVPLFCGVRVGCRFSGGSAAVGIARAKAAIRNAAKRSNMAVPPKAVLCVSIGLAAKVVKIDNYFSRHLNSALCSLPHTLRSSDVRAVSEANRRDRFGWLGPQGSLSIVCGSRKCHRRRGANESATSVSKFSWGFRRTRACNILERWRRPLKASRRFQKEHDENGH